MSELVSSALKDMGPAGAAISVLMTAVAALASAVVIQWKQANKVYGYRLAERDTLNKALTDSTAAIVNLTKATEELKEVTEKLADVIDKQVNAFGRVNDRIEMQHAVLKDELGRHGISIAEAARVYHQAITEIRNFLQLNLGRAR